MQKNTQQISGVFKLVIVLYQFIWHILLPFVLFRLWWKARKEPKYLENVLERLGFYQSKRTKKSIWIHAVSVGETRAATPLIKKLIDSGNIILLTHTTPTGRQTGAELFQKYILEGKLEQSYLPYDFCWPVSRFFKHFEPSIGLMMETEVWPSILFFSKNRFPVYLINGRLSVKSSHNFSKFGSLSKTLFGLFSGVFAQTQSDANEYQKFDIKNCIVTGNLKFDVPLDQNLIDLGVKWRSLFKDRQVIAIASSRDGEEKLIIQAWMKLKIDSKPLLILVPRHLTRMDEIEKFLQQEKIQYIKRSSMEIPESFSQDILIGDTMGEMSMYLSMADYVIMGGSWMGTGSQNLIEPISLGKPVILGPSTFNFADISQMAVKAGVALQTTASSITELENDLIKIMQRFIDHPKDLSDMERTCISFATVNQGATLKTLNNLKI